MNTQDLHDLVWRYRDELAEWWPTPPTDHALAFAVTEAGEAIDAWLRTFPEYARNNDKHHEELDEWADCAMMLVTALGRFHTRQSRNADKMDRLTIVVHISKAAYYAERIDSSAKSISTFSASFALAGIIHYLGGHENAHARIDTRLRRIAKKVTPVARQVTFNPDVHSRSTGYTSSEDAAE